MPGEELRPLADLLKQLVLHPLPMWVWISGFAGVRVGVVIWSRVLKG